MVVQVFCESAESDGVAEGRRRLGAVSAREPQDFWIELGDRALIRACGARRSRRLSVAYLRRLCGASAASGSAQRPLFLPPPLLEDLISLVHLLPERHFGAPREKSWYVDLVLGCEWCINGYAQVVAALFRWLSKKYPKISAFMTFSVETLCIDFPSKFFPVIEAEQQKIPDDEGNEVAVPAI